MGKQQNKLIGKRFERRGDPFSDRRSGEDRRKRYLLDYFLENNPERRSDLERRTGIERRSGCIQVDDWSSVCPDKEENLDQPIVLEK